MSLSGVVRSLAVVAFDAVEAVYYAVCDFNRAADEIWNDAGANALAHKEAEEEVAEPQSLLTCVHCPCGAQITLPRQSFAHRVVGRCPACDATFDIRLDAPSSSPASGSVGDEPPSRSAPPTGVEREGLQLTTLSAKDITDAAYAISRHAETREGSLRESWHELADRFDNAAKAMR